MPQYTRAQRIRLFGRADSSDAVACAGPPTVNTRVHRAWNEEPPRGSDKDPVEQYRQAGRIIKHMYSPSRVVEHIKDVHSPVAQPPAGSSGIHHDGRKQHPDPSKAHKGPVSFAEGMSRKARYMQSCGTVHFSQMPIVKDAEKRAAKACK